MMLKTKFKADTQDSSKGALSASQTLKEQYFNIGELHPQDTKKVKKTLRN